MATKTQRKLIKQLVSDHHDALAVLAIGENVVGKREARRLRLKGLIPIEPQRSLMEMAFDNGLGSIPFRRTELGALAALQKNAFRYTRRQKKMVRGAFREAMAEAMAEASPRMTKRELTGLITEKVKERYPSLLNAWRRVISTEINNAYQEGRFYAIIRKYPAGADPEVFKRPQPDACQRCKDLYLKSDGVTPKVFRLSKMLALGTNEGLKQKDWKATVGSVHPWCRCLLYEYPAGARFNSRGELQTSMIKAHVAHPGSRGGKFYYDKKGEVVYGKRPKPKTDDYEKNVKAIGPRHGTEFDSMGVRVSAGGPMKDVDAGISGLLEDINAAGYTSAQSHSGQFIDYPNPEKRSGSQDGYISFWKKDLKPGQEEQIESAAKRAGLFVDTESLLFFTPAVTVRSGKYKDGSFPDDLRVKANVLAKEQMIAEGLLGPDDWRIPQGGITSSKKETIAYLPKNGKIDGKDRFLVWLDRRDVIKKELEKKAGGVLDEKETVKLWADFKKELLGNAKTATKKTDESHD